MSADSPHVAEALSRWTFILMLGFVAALQLSIALAQTLLAATLACWVIQLAREGSWPAVPGWFTLLAAYAVATLVSSAFSLDPLASIVDSRQLLLFAIVPAVYSIARGPRATTVLSVVVTVGAASAIIGIVQYGVLQYDNLGQRPQGALTHYMTYSGILMLVLCAAVARVVFGTSERTWPALVLPALVIALVLTFTRSAWVGACVAVGLLLVLKDFRLSALLPVVVALLFAFAPDSITNRMMSVVDLQDPTSRDRIAMMRTGAAIIADFPLTGVGPDMIERVYPEYRDPSAVQATNPHLHNVPLQIGAERGLPAAFVWILFIGALFTALLKVWRGSADRVLPAAALAAVVAMLAAGLFEYNFGDSEFLMLFLVLVTLPFAAQRSNDTTNGPAFPSLSSSHS